MKIGQTALTSGELSSVSCDIWYMYVFWFSLLFQFLITTYWLTLLTLQWDCRGLCLNHRLPNCKSPSVVSSPKAFLSLFYRYSMFKYTSIALVSAGIFICTFMSAKQVVRFSFRSFVVSTCHWAPLPGICKEKKGLACLHNTGTQLCESGRKWTAEICPLRFGCCSWFWSLFLVYFLIS